MTRRKKQHTKNNKKQENQNSGGLIPDGVKQKIAAILAWLLGVVFALSFAGMAGIGGEYLKAAVRFLVGKAVIAVPFFFLLAGAVLFRTAYHRFLGSVGLGIALLLAGTAGLLGSRSIEAGFGEQLGGVIGYVLAWPVLKLFDIVVAQLVFAVVLASAFIVFWQLFREPARELVDHVMPEEADEEDTRHKSSAGKRTQRKRQATTGDQSKGRRKTTEKTSASSGQQPQEKKAAASASSATYPLHLLAHGTTKASGGDLEEHKRIIQETLDNFSIPVEMGEANVGPAVTQYTLKPAEGIKLSRITTLHNNLSLALAAHPLRIEAPIPGKSLVGVEIPNEERADVRLRDLLELKQFQQSGMSLPLALGRNVSGTAVFTDMAKMPHMLVAGATGSGKTIFLNTLILSLLQKNTPETLRLVMVDPKRVELHAYDDIPHLIGPVITKPDKTVLAIKWLISEMESRFTTLAERGARDIDSYNEKIRKENKKAAAGDETPVMPYIVFVVDEMADLMSVKGKEVEAGVVRLAQMARAVGIHLVLATQRPSVEVLTGLIKANITSRVALKVATQIDSRTIIDQGGAERLLGAGDMLFVSSKSPHPTRLQSPFISEDEIAEVVDWLKKQSDVSGDADLSASLEEALEGSSAGGGETAFGEDDAEDELYEEAKDLVIQSNKASASLLQRRLRIGYARAARLIDMLEESGVVGPQEGSKPRQVYGEPANEDAPDDEVDPEQREF